jgi:hypothetical protein
MITDTTTISFNIAVSKNKVLSYIRKLTIIS